VVKGSPDVVKIVGMTLQDEKKLKGKPTIVRLIEGKFQAKGMGEGPTGRMELKSPGIKAERKRTKPS